MKQPLYRVDIPAFNEEECRGTLHDRLTKVMRGLHEPCELLFVDDGSTDGTSSILGDLCGRDGACRAPFFSRNFGHQAAITAGMRQARGRAIVAIDADLQDPPRGDPRHDSPVEGG
jgi:polyisoprenyl-phosphate glycosyltransferase